MGDLKASWRDQSLCAAAIQETPILGAEFLTKETVAEPLIKSICESCPVRRDCLVDALSDRHAIGWRDGIYFEGGAVKPTDARRIMNNYGIQARTRQYRGN